LAGSEPSGGGELGPLDELTAFETGAGTDEGDGVGCIDGPPSSLGGLDELEDHGKRGGRAVVSTATTMTMPGCNPRCRRPG
jgi:hypothetical protein